MPKVNSDYTATNSGYLHDNPTWHQEDSPWKATQVLKMMERNKLHPKSVVEIGCGAGEILNQLHERMEDKSIDFSGYEISPDAYQLSIAKTTDRLHFFQEDLLTLDKKFDLLLMMDVFEHVEDYLGFIRKAGTKATYKIYHIPLDMSLLSVFINYPVALRRKVGHLHYFMKDTALSALQESGQEVIDWFYTPAAFDTNKERSFKGKTVNLLRRMFFRVKPDFAVKALGGFSLLVLTK